MDAFGKLRSERAPKESGKEFTSGPSYQRSVGLDEVRASSRFSGPLYLLNSQEVHSGYLKYLFDGEENAIQLSQQKGAVFKAETLEEVDNGQEGDLRNTVTPDFYPGLHRMLQEKKKPPLPFNFRGRAHFQPCLMEWTAKIISRNRNVLKRAEIYDAVVVAQYPFSHNCNVWRAFAELWGPTSNTLHHIGGEMGISLYDLKTIGGLPILGIPYEEFIPTNKKLLNTSLYHPCIVELLRIHSRLCNILKTQFVSWDQWTEYFYRGEQMFVGLKTEQAQDSHSKDFHKKP